MSVGLQGHVGRADDGWYGSPNGSGFNNVDISVDWVRVSQFTGATPPAPAPDPDPPAAGLTLTGTAKAELMAGGAAGDRLLGAGGADTLRGEGGHDTLAGNGGNDLLEGGAGDDVLRGGAGDDRIVTGAGADIVVFAAGEGADVVTDFQLGTDRVKLVGVAAEQVVAAVATRGGVAGLELRLPGGETLFLQDVAAASAKQLGLAGSFATGSPAPAPVVNVINGTAGDDWLKGTAGADSISGGAGSDDLQGLGGNDVLRGGKGHDGLTGGAGTDMFVFARGDGDDWVVDFQPGVEKIRLEGITAGQVVQHVETRWGMIGLELDFGGGDEMFLQGVAQKIAASDFVFA
jgi:Ca2+-binding RTX toxin-like protein